MPTASAGSIKIDALTPPPTGTVTGTTSFTVTGATMAPTTNGGGTAAGSFGASGAADQIAFTGTDPPFGKSTNQDCGNERERGGNGGALLGPFADG